MNDEGMAISSNAKHNELINQNVRDCDEMISKLLCQMAERSVILFREDIVNSLAALMTARAAYAESVYRENVVFVKAQGHLPTRGEEWKSGQ